MAKLPKHMVNIPNSSNLYYRQDFPVEYRDIIGQRESTNARQVLPTVNLQVLHLLVKMWNITVCLMLLALADLSTVHMTKRNASE